MRRALLLGAALLGAACSGAETKPAPARSVALLPFANESVEVEAPSRVRAVLSGLLKEKGYTAVDAAAVDAVLKDRFGVTDGGQLRVVTPEKLRGVLPGDLWVFGNVKEYTFKSAAALSQRKVILSLKVVEASSGKTLYEGEEQGITTRAGVDAAGDLAINLAGRMLRTKATDAVTDVELTQETREAVRKHLEKFPR